MSSTFLFPKLLRSESDSSNLRPQKEEALKNVSVQQYVCFLSGASRQIYNPTDTGSRDFMHVTAATHDAPAAHECLVCCSGVGARCGVPVWGDQLFQPLPESDEETGQIVTAAIVALLRVSSSHRAERVHAVPP